MNKIKEIRERNNLTQRQIGELAGYSSAGISQIESGKKQPRISGAQKIVAAFNRLGVSCDFNEVYPPEELKQAS